MQKKCNTYSEGPALKCLVTGCKPTTTRIKPPHHMARWLGKHSLWPRQGSITNYWPSSTAEYILYYKMYERVTNLCNILNCTNIINMNGCEKRYLKFPFFTIINRHLLFTAPSTLSIAPQGLIFQT